MKNSNYSITSRRVSVLSGVMALGLMMLSSGVHAYILDTKIGQATLGNSGDATEQAAMAAAISAWTSTTVTAADLTLDLKLDQASLGFNVTADSSVLGQWFIDVSPKAPGFFMLKFGTGNLVVADHFFFANIGEMTKLVFSNEQVSYLSGGSCGFTNSNACNIGKLSHYSIFGGSDDGGGPPQAVPEPGALLLVGAGLLGLGWSRRRPSA